MTRFQPVIIAVFCGSVCVGFFAKDARAFIWPCCYCNTNLSVTGSCPTSCGPGTPNKYGDNTCVFGRPPCGVGGQTLSACKAFKLSTCDDGAECDGGCTGGGDTCTCEQLKKGC